ncbi:hypothetical protein [Ectobacillus polymachus]|uniref:hypothetical protein n=1 Tax=Ectobacillus polymachus TaxID=1508806 RepID=UPI003A86B4BC
MKKKKRFKWLILVPIMAIMLFTGFQVAEHIVGHRYANYNMHSMMSSQGQGLYQQSPFQGGNQLVIIEGNGNYHNGMMYQNGMMEHRGYGHHEREFVGLSILEFFLALGAILTGWLLWRGAKQGPRKWIGLTLMGLGALSTFPILLIAAAIYWILKKVKHDDNDFVKGEYTPVQTVKHTDFLDEWERKINEEEK